MDYCTSCGYEGVVHFAEDAAVVAASNGMVPGTYPDGVDGWVPAFSHDDPHCRNLRGQRFDIRAWGALTMVRIPRAETLGAAGFAVAARVEPSSARRCGQ